MVPQGSRDLRSRAASILWLCTSALDFFLWGFVKNFACVDEIRDVGHFETVIRDALPREVAGALARRPHGALLDCLGTRTA
jgi:hypothetical protein